MDNKNECYCALCHALKSGLVQRVSVHHRWLVWDNGQWVVYQRDERLTKEAEGNPSASFLRSKLVGLIVAIGDELTRRNSLPFVTGSFYLVRPIWQNLLCLTMC